MLVGNRGVSQRMFGAFLVGSCQTTLMVEGGANSFLHVFTIIKTVGKSELPATTGFRHFLSTY